MMNADDVELRDIRASGTLSSYLNDIWQRRDFLIVVPRQDARARNMTSVLGQAWHLLNPLIMTGVYYVVFAVILGVDRGIDSFIAFLTTGVLLFQLCQRITQESAGAISANEGLVRSIQFPRALLPISVAIQHLVSFVPAVGVMVVVALIDTGEITWRITLLPVALASAAAVSLGLGLFAARIGAFVQDLREILPHAFRILLYFSGVLFSIDRFVSNQLAKDVLTLNPIFGFISVARWCLSESPVDQRLVISLVVWSVLLPTTGLIWFRRAELRYGG